MHTITGLSMMRAMHSSFTNVKVFSMHSPSWIPWCLPLRVQQNLSHKKLASLLWDRCSQPVNSYAGNRSPIIMLPAWHNTWSAPHPWQQSIVGATLAVALIILTVALVILTVALIILMIAFIIPMVALIIPNTSFLL